MTVAKSGGGAGRSGLRLEEAPEHVVEEEAEENEKKQVVEQAEHAEHGLWQQIERHEQVNRKYHDQQQEAHTQQARVRAVAPDGAPRVPHHCRHLDHVIEKLRNTTIWAIDCFLTGAQTTSHFMPL